MKEQTLNYPFSEDQTFSMALIKYKNNEFHSPDYEIYYLKNIKPISKETSYWLDTMVNEWDLVFNTFEIIGFNANVHSRCILKKSVDSFFGYSLIVSTEDNEKELKEILIKYQIHEIEKRLNNIEEEKRKFKKTYLKLSKYLIGKYL